METLDRKQNNHLTEYQISLAADAFMDGKQSILDSHITLHLEDCDSCREAVMEVIDMQKAMETGEDGNTESLQITKKKTLKKKRQVITLVAATIILLIASNIIFWLKQKEYKNTIVALNAEKNDFNNYPDLINEIDSLKGHIAKVDSLVQKNTEPNTAENEAQDGSKKLYTSLYQKNEALEEEMKLVLRSGKIKILSPVKEIFKNNNEITFKWEITSQTPDLIIYNNKGMPVLKKEKIMNGYMLHLNKFSLGTYYYELHINGDMEVMGRFEIH